MNPQPPQPQAAFEQRIQTIEQRMTGIENKFKEENFQLRREQRQIEAGHREIQAERLSLNIVARDLAKLQRNIKQTYDRAVLILALAAAVYAGYRAGQYVRFEHALTIMRSYGDIETLSIANRFWGSLGDNELTVVIAAAGALAAVAGFFAVWLSSHIIKWLLVDYLPTAAPSTASEAKQNKRDDLGQPPPD
jgi:hypothetical protein